MPGDAAPNPAEPLTGRGEELELIRSFTAGLAGCGGALLLTGDPGMGKTVLLDAAAAMASAAGMRVLRAAGAEFEADVSYSGLNQVLFGIREETERLSPAYRDALSVALGFGYGPVPGPLVVRNAALALLRQAAADRPLLVMVDDLPWLDRASAAALGFIARRLDGSRVGFLGAARTGTASFFDRVGLPAHELGPLDDKAAASLVSTGFPVLAHRVRQRVLAEAQGNPLALLELPTALSGAQRSARRALPAVLPLTRRLEELFATRASALPEKTRQVLLLSVLDGTGDLGVLEAAAGIADLAPAEEARLVRVDHGSGRLEFRHPLTRSAIVELSTSDQRRRAHRELARLAADQTERRAWHLAEAAVEPDEEVAALLEQAADGTLRRGDAPGAVAALLRAADLSPDAADRGRRIARAAYTGADVTGELSGASQLLTDVRRAGSGASLLAAVATAHVLLNGDGDVDTAHHLLAGAIEISSPGGDDSAFAEALYTLMLVCWFGGRPELWEAFDTALARGAPRVPGLLAMSASTFADPARATAGVLARLDAAIDALRDEADPSVIVRTADAAEYVDRIAGCREPLRRLIRDGREGGAVASAINAMMVLCFDEFRTGQWDEADELVSEGLALCETHGYRLLAWLLRYAQALLAAVRGDDAGARELAGALTRWAAPRQAGAVQRYASHVYALTAIGRGDFEDAYQHAAAISPPGVFAPRVSHALRVPMDLVEAAVRTGRHAEAAAHVAAMRETGIAAISPRLALLTAGSAALASPDDRAAALYEEAITTSGAGRWPFELARIQLAYGEHLRRARATTQARAQLTAAGETFRRLGARPWAARADSELRAAGLAGRRVIGPGPASLTPQEYEIAALAAAGLTNKQIGERLNLSHRTVGAHLYQIFPKLGISTRAALRDALAGLEPAGAPASR